MIQRSRAYVLHSKPYSETSLIIDLFCQEQGRISVLARGARRKKSPLKPILQNFTPLDIDYRGKRELKTLMRAEIIDHRIYSQNGDGLICGLYLNELIYRLLPKEHADQHLFLYYEAALNNIFNSSDIEPVLRVFEIRLLQALGYGLDFTWDYLHQSVVNADDNYIFYPGQGFTRTTGTTGLIISGQNLLDIDALNFTQPQTRLAAKQLMRTAINDLLGHIRLQSRALFI